jgi:ketosteroid isomerase-like protein
MIRALCLAPLVLAACATTSVDVAATRKALLQRDTEFAAASKDKGLAVASDGYLADDATALPPGRDAVNGKSAAIDLYKAVTGAFTWEPKASDVGGAGDVGYTWGEFKIVRPDNAGEFHGKYVSIWKKQADGSWKVAVSIGNSNEMLTPAAAK